MLVRRLRSIIINTGKRSDGRGVEDVRPISIDTSLLPGAHGSSLFTRGETQSLSTATLGEIRGDGIRGEGNRGEGRDQR